jgi:hypothetical protein
MEVLLKFIRKDPWSNITKYPNCKEYLVANWTRSGQLATGLNKEDQARLEKELGYPEGHLSPSVEFGKPSFWTTYAIIVPSNGLVLHTEDPTDELKYLLAKAHKRVANNQQEIKPGHDFVLINVEQEAEVSNKQNRVKRQAFAELGKLTPAECRKALRLFGMNGTDANIEVVENKLFESVDKYPQKFLDLWVNNKHRDIQYLISEAVSKNVIRRNKNVYTYGTDTLGTSLEDTIATLIDKKNQEVKLAIEHEIQSK